MQIHILRFETLNGFIFSINAYKKVIVTKLVMKCGEV